AGSETIQAAQRAMGTVGWQLDASGDLYPQRIAGLEGRALSGALRQYVRRIQQAGDDDALTIGAAKELLEAAARHVMVESTGSYDPKADFPTTMYRAATTLGTGTPTAGMIQDLDDDPARALEQALALVALTISRLRNAEGSGHGRPQMTRATKRQGIIAANAAAAVAYVLLKDLTD
ncbi:MAG TPA: abortive infection family protein, partial [Thermomicrobiales bacterium]|nr:abortive infection family protein [Thermomicrobiales bacterium]